MKYPPRIPRTVIGSKRERREGDCPEHRKFVRAQRCIYDGVYCAGPMHAHHVRTAANSGTGMKPDDKFCVPLCAAHHSELHSGILHPRPDWIMHEAEKLAAKSPALRRVRMKT